MKMCSSRTSRLALAFASSALALSAQSATASNIPATARIFVPITVSLTNAGLSFGDVYANVTGGNVVLDPATDLRTSTGGLVLGTVGVASSAVIKVGGTRGSMFAITVPANSFVTLTGPGTAMPLTGFTVAVGAAALTAPFVSQLPNVAGATLTFKVGATLVVPPNQLDGSYTGAFAVTVAYN